MSRPSDSTTRRARSGFTLLEAAIAVMIVGLAAVAVLSSFGTTLRTGERARRGLEAEALAGQRLAIASLLSNAELTHVPDSVSRGRFDTPFDGYAWQTTAREVRGEEGLFDVAVEVTWENGRYELPTRLYRPAEKLGATR
jgi:prepilin-type N-terminal cleavage/methylation domain-containing protein